MYSTIDIVVPLVLWSKVSNITWPNNVIPGPTIPNKARTLAEFLDLSRINEIGKKNPKKGHRSNKKAFDIATEKPYGYVPEIKSDKSSAHLKAINHVRKNIDNPA